MAIVNYTTEELKTMKSKSDMERIISMTDDDIVYDDDSPDLSAFIKEGEVCVVRRGRPPVQEPKEKVTIRVNAGALRVLRASGKGWQTRLSDQIEEWALSAKG